ncbi:hypothetical protein ACIPSE_17360 [Streptomyces sp. NPDC090106]|uniref:hypothetical protein n=1 Tax=Streptomyces sp. NPDC090106 TaxID=3365946 RepID=UPI003823C1E3
MVEQQQEKNMDETGEVRRRKAGIAAFLTGLIITLAFFAFWPGLPHVIDWGAILVALAVGVIARWLCRSQMAKAARRKSERP